MWTPVPNLPHVFYGSSTDRMGQYWIHFHCARCGDVSKKPCANPARTNYWVVTYGRNHVRCR